MMSAVLEVQAAIYEALSNDAALTGLLGGTHIFDAVPAGQAPPYLVFGPATYRDWSTGTEPGLEQELSLIVWTQPNGRKQAMEIAEQVLIALGPLPQALAENTIVNFAHTLTSAQLDRREQAFRVALNFRAVTEPS